MTNRVFFIGDLHLGHKRIIEYEAKHRSFSDIDEHDQEIVKRWNSVVTSKDTVWVLGDVCLNKDKMHLVGELKGFKKLILGNHDLFSMEVYSQYFTKIYGVVEYKDMILSHMPLHPSQLWRAKYNIHGHLHSHKVMKSAEEASIVFTKDSSSTAVFPMVEDRRYINVSAECVNLTPIEYSELLEL